MGYRDGEFLALEESHQKLEKRVDMLERQRVNIPGRGWTPPRGEWSWRMDPEAKTEALRRRERRYAHPYRYGLRHLVVSAVVGGTSLAAAILTLCLALG